MAERVRGDGVIDVRMNDGGRRQRVPRRMAEGVRQCTRDRQRGPGRDGGRGGRRYPALFRALGQGRGGGAVRP